MPSLLKILSQMTGLQKLSVVRNLIVLPLLLLSFTLGGGVFGLTAPIVLPWVLYMGFNLGSNSHRLQATHGFQLAIPPPKYLGLSTKVWYILSCVIGIVYIGVIGVLLPDADNAPAPQALLVAVIGAAFLGLLLTLVGIRLGWSSVEACAPGTDPAKTLRLVNPAGVKRQQWIYLGAGVFVLIGALSSLSHTYPRWAGDGSDAPASSAQGGETLEDLEAQVSSTSTESKQAATAQPTQADPSTQPTQATQSAAPPQTTQSTQPIQEAQPAASGPAVAAQAAAAPAVSLPSLCMAGESTVWTGTKGQKIFSLCASANLSQATGYLQYRAGTAGDIQFKYPEALENPHGIFSYSEAAHSVEVDFSNGGYSYSISEQADGSETDIDVTLPSGKASTIVLDKASDALGQNATMDLFQKLGLSQ